MTRLHRCLAIVLALPLAALAPTATAAPAWRVILERPAPWGAPAMVAPAGRVGHTVQFDATRVTGPDILTCGRARIDATTTPPEGLFQGNLPAPAAASAQALGLSASPVTGIRLTCETGVFEFHYAAADTMLLGLDNQILVLSRAEGARARPDTPEGRVQRLLETHFAGDIAFTPTRIAAQRHALTTRLTQYIERYFSRPPMPGEPPAIEGDPFTDSATPPAWFAVGRATKRGQAMNVPVRFADGPHARVVIYRMIQERGAWRLLDVGYARGDTFRDRLE